MRSKRELGERKRTENAGPSEKTSLKISCFQLPRTAERKVEREREKGVSFSAVNGGGFGVDVGVRGQRKLRVRQWAVSTEYAHQQRHFSKRKSPPPLPPPPP